MTQQILTPEAFQAWLEERKKALPWLYQERLDWKKKSEEKNENRWWDGRKEP